MKPKSKIDLKLANVETEAIPRHLDFKTDARLLTFETEAKLFKRLNLRLPQGETVSRGYITGARVDLYCHLCMVP